MPLQAKMRFGLVPVPSLGDTFMPGYKSYITVKRGNQTFKVDIKTVKLGQGTARIALAMDEVVLTLGGPDSCQNFPGPLQPEVRLPHHKTGCALCFQHSCASVQLKHMPPVALCAVAGCRTPNRQVHNTPRLCTPTSASQAI